MQQHLGISVNPPVELVIRLWRLVNAHLVRHDKGWLGATGNDQVSKVAVVGLDVTLASAEGETLESIISKVKGRKKKTENSGLTFSKSLPNERRIWPLPDFSSGAPGSYKSVREASCLTMAEIRLTAGT